MNAQQFTALHTRRIAESMVQFLRSTQQHRLAWRPPVQTGRAARSALEITAECVAVNIRYAVLLKTGEDRLADEPIFAHADEACTALQNSAEELAQIIEALPDHFLQQTLQTLRGEVRADNAIIAPYRNMAYHCGQINLVQSLTGDSEFHVPSNWR